MTASVVNDTTDVSTGVPAGGTPADATATGRTNPLLSGVTAPVGGTLQVPDSPATGGPTPGRATPGQTPFTAGSNLIGTQFAPGPSAGQQRATGLTETAATNLANYQFSPFQELAGSAPGNAPVSSYDQGQSRSLLDAASRAAMAGGGGGPGSFALSGDTGTARGLTLAQLQQVMGTNVDRGKLAGDTYKLLEERSQPEFEQGLRRIGQSAAALGRVGAGMTTNELTGLGTLRERGLDQSRRQLATESAGLTLQDALDKLTAGNTTSSNFAGQDLGAGGLNLSYAQEGRAGRGQNLNDLRLLASDYQGLGRDAEGSAVRERDVAYGVGRDQFADRAADRTARGDYETRGYNQARGSLGDLSGYQASLDQEARAGRNELRGERDYQYGLSRDAQGDAVDQRLMEERLMNERFGRGERMFGLGYGGQNPGTAYGALAGQYGQQAQASGEGLSDLLAAYGQRRNTAGAPAGGGMDEWLRRIFGGGGALPTGTRVDDRPALPPGMS